MISYISPVSFSHRHGDLFENTHRASDLSRTPFYQSVCSTSKLSSKLAVIFYQRGTQLSIVREVGVRLKCLPNVVA